MSNLRKSLLSRSIGSIYGGVEEDRKLIPETNPSSPAIKEAMDTQPVKMYSPEDVLCVFEDGKVIGWITRVQKIR